MLKDTKLAIICISIAYVIGGVCYALDSDLIKDLIISNIINQFLLIVGVTIVLWVIIIFLRWKYLEYHGMTSEEYISILGNRKNFNLEKYQALYDHRVLIISDGIFRKVNHIITTIFNLIVITYYTDTDNQKLQLSILGQITLVSVSILFYRTNTIISFLVYGTGSRIRDGKSARLNILTVRMIGIPSFIIIGTLMDYSSLLDKLTVKEKKISLMMIYLPLIVGDAMGEIIGSLFGKHTFKVYGIGEINKKSIEGTFAVFLGSLVSIMIMCGYNQVDTKTYLIGTVISIVSTFTELIALRSTDNFFIPIINLLVLICFN
jgi:dolichol kinase